MAREVRRWKWVDGVVGIVRSAACALTTRKHTSRNRCVRVSRVFEAGAEVGAVWKIAAILYTRAVSVCVFGIEYFDDCIKSNMATIKRKLSDLFHA